MPEPILFGGTPPPDATQIAKLAFYLPHAGVAVGMLGSLVTFSRAKQKGVGACVTAGLGLLGVGCAAFVGQALLNNFLYQENPRALTETRLLLLGGAATLVAVGVNLIPGYRPKAGAWMTTAIPALAGAGFALAGIGQLGAVPASVGMGLGVLGGLLPLAAGVLVFLDKNRPGKNPQEPVTTAYGTALASSGLLVAIGSALARSDGGVDKGSVVIALAEIIFALFSLLGLLAIVGSPADFPSAAKAAKSPAIIPPGGDIPPPPGGFPPPPPPGGPAIPLPPPTRAVVAPPTPTVARPAQPAQPAQPARPAPAQPARPAQSPAQSPAPQRHPSAPGPRPPRPPGAK